VRDKHFKFYKVV